MIVCGSRRRRWLAKSARKHAGVVADNSSSSNNTAAVQQTLLLRSQHLEERERGCATGVATCCLFVAFIFHLAAVVQQHNIVFNMET